MLGQAILLNVSARLDASGSYFRREMMKVVNEVSWMIGGPQGTGVDSSANLFSQACATAGLWVFGKREYHSNIKGKHSYFQVRVSNESDS